jgi:hypothetical protein
MYKLSMYQVVPILLRTYLYVRPTSYKMGYQDEIG